MSRTPATTPTPVEESLVASQPIPGEGVDQVFLIPIDAVVPSRENPRRSFDQPALEELAQSIRANGVQVPLLVRMTQAETQGDRFICEIVCGERRWRAAKLAGLATVPAIARSLTDEQAREIALIENLQRQDIPALEEADAYSALLAALGTPSRVAGRVGKPFGYVVRRLQLCTLIEPARQALAEQLITVDHALVLAKLAQKAQEKALGVALHTRSGVTVQEGLAEARRDREGDCYWEPVSVVMLKEHISETRLALKDAPWDLADAGLVASAGACTACPANSGHNTALFGDLVIEDASCMNAACYAEKKKAFVARQLRAIEGAGKDAVRISWKESAAKPRMVEGHVVQDQVFKAGQWIAAKKDDPCRVQAVAVDDDAGFRPDKTKKIGAHLLVCVAPGCRVHPKTWEMAALPKKAGGSAYDPKAEAEKRKQREAAAAAENKIRLELAHQAITKASKLSPEALRAILKGLAQSHAVGALYPAAKAALSARIDSPHFAKLVAAIALLDSYQIGQWQPVDVDREEFLARLKMLGVDGGAAYKRPKKASAKQQEPAAAKAAKGKKTPKVAARKPAASKLPKDRAAIARVKAVKKGGKR